MFRASSLEEDEARPFSKTFCPKNSTESWTRVHLEGLSLVLQVQPKTMMSSMFSKHVSQMRLVSTVSINLANVAGVLHIRNGSTQNSCNCPPLVENAVVFGW